MGVLGAGLEAREAGVCPAATSMSRCRSPSDAAESQSSSGWRTGRCCPPLPSSLGSEVAGRGQPAPILKGELISLLPVLGKCICSQKCY